MGKDQTDTNRAMNVKAKLGCMASCGDVCVLPGLPYRPWLQEVAFHIRVALGERVEVRERSTLERKLDARAQINLALFVALFNRDRALAGKRHSMPEGFSPRKLYLDTFDKESPI